MSFVAVSWIQPTLTAEFTGVGVTRRCSRRCARPRTRRAIVVVTSDKCYRNDGSGHPFREDDPLGGDDPYAASKAGQEHVAEAYRAMGMPIATVRAGNVIGGGDWAPDRLLADCMRAALRDEPVVVRAPDAVRPWQHVLGPLDGYLRSPRRCSTAPRPRPGTSAPRTPPRSAGSCSRWPTAGRAGWSSSRARRRGGRRGAAAAARRDPRPERARLGAAAGTCEAALDATVAWYGAYRAGADMRAETLAQIAATAVTDPRDGWSGRRYRVRA